MEYYIIGFFQEFGQKFSYEYNFTKVTNIYQPTTEGIIQYFTVFLKI